MSFQAYLDNIKTKTGKTPDDFIKLAEKKGLLKPGTKAGEIVDWLKKDFDLGHGHAMAIYAVLKSDGKPQSGAEDSIAKHFTGNKSSWRAVFDKLLSQLQQFGDGIQVAPTSSYLSILNGDKKFAIVQVTGDRMDIGVKLKGVKPIGRLEPSDSWNAMVTHRVRIADPKQVDKELISWLRDAYEQTTVKKTAKK